MNGQIFTFSLPFWLQYRHTIKAQNPKLMLFVEVLTPQHEKDLEKLEWLLPEARNKINFHLIVLSPTVPVYKWTNDKWRTWFFVGTGSVETSLVLAQQLSSLYDLLPETEMRIFYRLKTTFDVSHVFRAWGRENSPIDASAWDIDLTLLDRSDLNVSNEAKLLRGLLNNRREILSRRGTPPDLGHFFNELHQRFGARVQHFTPQKVRNIDNYIIHYRQKLSISV